MVVGRSEVKGKDKIVLGVTLALTDALMVGLAFYGSYHLRLLTEHVNIGPFRDYVGMLVIHVVSVLLVFFMAKMYHRQRAISHVDELSGRVLLGVYGHRPGYRHDFLPVQAGHRLPAPDDGLCLGADPCCP